MSLPTLTAMRDLIQQDIGGRGLTAYPQDNLLTACPDDFAAACRSLAETKQPRVLIVTGFYIANADPPCGETDGPLGAVFLARALVPLGFDVSLASDGFCLPALRSGVESCGVAALVPTIEIGADVAAWQASPPTHVIAIERVGPNHRAGSIECQPGATAADVAAFEGLVPPQGRDRCYSMRGRDLTAFTHPAHRLFEEAATSQPAIATIGIGDGGNEIGMGKVRWDVIRRNIPNGGLIACRVPTDYLIVCGVSNWGAYGLAAGVRLLRGAPHDPKLFDRRGEREILETMVREGPLVDGKTGERVARVDGLAFDDYAAVLEKLGRMNV